MDSDNMPGYEYDWRAVAADLRQQLATVEAVALANKVGFEEYERRYYLELDAREAAEAERDRAVKDAERYHFLRDIGPPDAVTGYPTILQWKLVTQDRHSGRLLFGDELDAAIDAAIAAAAGDAGGEHG